MVVPLSKQARHAYPSMATITIVPADVTIGVLSSKHQCQALTSS